MKFKFKYKHFNYNLEVKKCQTIISKFLGLMFTNKPTALLFIFKKPNNQPIHSFFCKPFIAVWFNNNNKVVDAKLVKPYNLSIIPKKPFTKLLEIPSNNDFFKIILDEIRKV